jgi:hypothetical protein
MCIAVTTTWINTGVTPEDIRRVFYRQPYLVCILAKRHKDSKLIWARRPSQPLSPAQPPPLPSPSPQIPSRPDTKFDTTMQPFSSFLPTVETERNDSQLEIGECISYDNVGPISPESIEGYQEFIAFRDTRSKSPLLLPSQDLQRGQLPLPPSAGRTILHQQRIQTSYPPQRLLHNLPLSQGQPVL